jgi:AAA family ATP:ADP antiporter
VDARGVAGGNHSRAAVARAMNATPSRLGRLLGRSARIEREELPVVLAAFMLLFCVLGGYFAVRPVRETIGSMLGRGVTSNLWLYTAAFALLLVPVYGALVAKVRRSILLPAIYGGTAVALAATGLAFSINPANTTLGKIFYVAISVLNLLLLSVFWSQLLERFSSEQSQRLFGVIAAGGTAGALVGPALTSLLVHTIGVPGVLYMGAGLFAVAVFLQRVVLRWQPGNLLPVSAAAATTGTDRALGGNPLAGFRQVFGSRYLFGIMLFVICLSALNTFLYFEQLELVEKNFAAAASRTRVFANLDAIVQALVIITQLFLTGRIAKRLGVTALLVFIPLVMIFGLLSYSLFQGFAVLAVAMVVRRWGEYAFIRPGREMLFSAVDRESKYKAKNLIDVGVYRVADAGFAQAGKALGTMGVAGSIQALWVAGLAGVWALIGWWLGRAHRKRTS